MAESQLVPATPAATLVLFREREDGPPELLVVERAGTMSFAAGALVFPGGRIDPSDHELAIAIGADDPEDAAARIAALRETVEESGLLVATDPAPDEATVARIRERMIAGESFGALLAEYGLALALDSLTPWARWRPNFRETRVFDTRFYLARVAPDAHEATVDATENVRLFWASAAAVLEECDAGRAHVIFPTRRNLERLALHDSHAAAVAHAEAHPVRMVTPWIEEREDGRYLCIPDGLGYPVCVEPLSSAFRA